MRLVFATLLQFGGRYVLHLPSFLLKEILYLCLPSQYFLSVFQASETVVTVIGAVTNAVLWISAVLTIISGAVYVYQNKGFIDPKK